jgi:imidazoleglycerol-phosphate dehydratase/histidinol-phosphatase
MPTGIQKKTTNLSENNSSRSSNIERKTKETQVMLKINLDGSGKSTISTKIQFLSHMLELFSRHSGIDLELTANGDLNHHVTEDVAICLGNAFLEALGDKKGIKRYGDKIIPMDESLATCAVDLGGRAFHHIDLKTQKGLIEDCSSEDLEHFFETIAINAKINLHILVHYGTNEHHKVEASFKAFAYAMKEAIEIVGNEIPSTKGVL